ncbi:MAG: hypothetical protein V9H69_15830 [Anaerolineae bacterium]
MDEGWIVAWLALALALILIALAAAAEVSLGAISRANIRRLLDEGISPRRLCKRCWTIHPGLSWR